jgi:predicted RNase H-like nuclease
MSEADLLFGIDGCTYGWIVANLYDGDEWNFELFSRINEFWKKYHHANLILIDIPIGLREKGDKARLCDKKARKILTRKRSSSIFPTPCRSAAYASSYKQANKINKELTGKGLSKQTWNITGKIKEVDTLLRQDNHAQKIFIESHPEICFTALNGGKPMNFYKKTKKGVRERIKLISLRLNSIKSTESILDSVMSKFSKKDVDIDDILDAWILAISGSKGISHLRFLPDKYEYDSENLPMRMAIPNFR